MPATTKKATKAKPNPKLNNTGSAKGAATGKTTPAATKAAPKDKPVEHPENFVDLNGNKEKTESEQSSVVRINKVKLIGTRKIEIKYQKQVGEEWFDYSCQGRQQNIAIPFASAINALVPLAIDICEAKDCWVVTDIKVTGVSISYDDNDSMGAVITAQMKIPDRNVVLNINTPCLKEPNDYLPGEFSEDEWVKIENLLQASKSYCEGLRATEQLTLI